MVKSGAHRKQDRTRDYEFPAGVVDVDELQRRVLLLSARGVRTDTKEKEEEEHFFRAARQGLFCRSEARAATASERANRPTNAFVRPSVGMRERILSFGAGIN